jgi:hypothetical protein
MIDLVRRIALSAAALLALSSALQADIVFFPPNDRVTVSTQPTLNAGVADLSITCSIKGAELYIDKSEAGLVPYSGQLPPGSHYFEVSLPGYYNLGIWLTLQEKTLYSVIFNLARITGLLSLTITPADATVLIDGAAVGGSLVEVPEGAHKVTVKAFGYVEKNAELRVEGRMTTTLAVTLEKATFAVTGLSFARSAFNPNNAGASGRNPLSFRVSSFGSATAEIRGLDGSIVARLDFLDMRTWSQSRDWDGLGSDGKPLPDGNYVAKLTAKPSSGVPVQAEGTTRDGQEIHPDGSIVATASTRIDSSLVVRSFGTLSAMPGMAYIPDTVPQPDGTVATEATWFAPWGNFQASAFGLSAALSLASKATLAVSTTAETGDAPNNAVDLAISALVAIGGDRSSTLSAAFFLRGSYSSTSSPAMPGSRTAIESSIPVALRVGIFSLSFAPGACIDYSASSPEFFALARSGFWLEGRNYRAGLSGELPIAFTAGSVNVNWPANIALEGRLMLGASPFVLSSYLGTEISPSGFSQPVLGIGLGLLF